MKISQLESALQELLARQGHVGEVSISEVDVVLDVHGTIEDDDGVQHFEASVGLSINDIKTKPRVRLEEVTILT